MKIRRLYDNEKRITLRPKTAHPVRVFNGKGVWLAEVFTRRLHALRRKNGIKTVE